ncbi:MAG: hypothetical protein DRN14_06190 [Thermoplasmata archaeon]|nr:MAG: hypothetical protein DRN14_06190 [Thermoplasmata archaeon]
MMRSHSISQPRRAVSYAFIFTLSLVFAVASASSVSARPSHQLRRPSHHAYERSALTRRHTLTRSAQRRWHVDAYHDPKVDVRAVNKKLEAFAKAHPKNVKLTALTHVSGEPLYRVDVMAAPQVGGNKGNKAKTKPTRPLRVLLSSGVHGNEPTGVYATLALLGKILKDDHLRQRFFVTFIPMVNSSGLAAMTRKNARDQDINRSFIVGHQTAEGRALTRSLGGERFDLSLDLHGAFREGFFLIRAKDDGTISQRILSSMPSAALLAPAPGESAVGPYELHSRGGATSNNPGTFKGFMSERSTYSYTLEYPRRLASKRQLSGLLRLVGSALNNVDRHGQRN